MGPDRPKPVEDILTFLDPKPHQEAVLVPEPLARYPFKQRLFENPQTVDREVRDPSVQADISLQVVE